MIEGLWSMEFISNSSFYGAGVVVFESERVFGGDAQYYYLGKYSISNNVLEVKAEVIHYNGEPISIFGPSKKHTVMLSGKIKNDIFEVEGHLIDNPRQIMRARLTKRAELP